MWQAGQGSAGTEKLSQVVYVKKANLWRDYFNPLRYLTMQRIVSFIEQASTNKQIHQFAGNF